MPQSKAPYFPDIPPELARRFRKTVDDTKYTRNIELFIEDMAPAKGARILEVGSGEGILVVMLCKMGFDAVGLEPGDAYVRNAARLLEHNELDPDRVLLGCAERMPFPDAFFDFVISYYTLEHVQDLEQTFREIERVLKPGGRTFHICPNYNSFFEGHFRVFMLPFMSKRAFRNYIRVLKWLKFGRDRMPSVEFADSLCFVRPQRVRAIGKLQPGLRLSESNGGVISVRHGRMVFGNRKLSEKLKRSRSRDALYKGVEIVNRLRLGGLLYTIMMRRKWYPNIKIVGTKESAESSRPIRMGASTINRH